MDKVGPMAPYGAYGYLEPRFKNTINGDSSRLETKATLDLKPPIELWLYKHLESWSDERTWRALFKVKLSATLHACFKFSAAWLGRQFPLSLSTLKVMCDSMIHWRSMLLAMAHAILKLCNLFSLASFIHWLLILQIWQTRNSNAALMGPRPSQFDTWLLLARDALAAAWPNYHQKCQLSSTALYRSQVWNSVKNQCSYVHLIWYYTQENKGTTMKPMCEVHQKNDPRALWG